MEQQQQSDDPYNDRTALQSELDDVFPEKADDDENYNDDQNGCHDPDKWGDLRKVYGHNQTPVRRAKDAACQQPYSDIPPNDSPRRSSNAALTI